MNLIYLLEDDVVLCNMIDEMVSTLGYRCKAFTECDPFIQACVDEAPDLIIMDMWLGKTNAIDIRKLHKPLLGAFPTMLISGGGGDRNLEHVTARANIAGFCDIIYKPVTISELGGHLETPFQTVS